MKTDQELADECNALAREFYRTMGYNAPENFRFWALSDARPQHPTEKLCWELAVAAHEHLRGDDIVSALDSIEGAAANETR